MRTFSILFSILMTTAAFAEPRSIDEMFQSAMNREYADSEMSLRLGAEQSARESEVPKSKRLILSTEDGHYAVQLICVRSKNDLQDQMLVQFLATPDVAPRLSVLRAPLLAKTIARRTLVLPDCKAKIANIRESASSNKSIVLSLKNPQYVQPSRFFALDHKNVWGKPINSKEFESDITIDGLSIF